MIFLKRQLFIHLLTRITIVLCDFYKTAKKCQVTAKVKEAVGHNLINMSFEKSDAIFYKVYRKLSKEELFRKRYGELFFAKYKDAYDNNQRVRLSSLKSELVKLLPIMSKDYQQIVNAFMLLPKFEQSYEKLLTFKFELDEKEFNPESFNKQLQKYFGEVQQYSQALKPLIDTGYSEVIIRAYGKLMTIYERSSDLILEINPAGKEKAFIHSFKKSMAPIAAQFRREAKKFQGLAYWCFTKKSSFGFKGAEYLE